MKKQHIQYCSIFKNSHFKVTTIAILTAILLVGCEPKTKVDEGNKPHQIEKLSQEKSITSSSIQTNLGNDTTDNLKQTTTTGSELANAALLSSTTVQPFLKEAKTLYRGVVGHDFTTNPQLVVEPSQLDPLYDMYAGLFGYNAQGELVPNIAKSWTTKDNKTWIITLKKSSWSNGEPLTAEDFVKSWYIFADGKHPLGEYLVYMGVLNSQEILNGKKQVETLGVKALSSDKLEIQLIKPEPQLPAMLAFFALYPIYTQLSSGVVSNGAYRLIKQTPSQWILEKNPYYQESKASSFEKVEYQVKTKFSDFSAQKEDLITHLKQRESNSRPVPSLCSYFYQFNLNDPQLKDANVRQAINSLISRQAIAAHVALPGRVSDSWLPLVFRQHNPYSGQIEEPVNFENKPLEELLKKAGVTPEHPLNLTLTVDNKPLHIDIAKQLIRMLSQSDLIHIHLDEVDYATLLSRQAQGNFQLIRSGWCADYLSPMSYLSLFHSKSKNNHSGYSNSQYDSLLDQSFKYGISVQQREELFQQAEQILQKNTLVLPLFLYEEQLITSPDIVGIDWNNPTEVIESKDLRRKN